MKKAAGEMSKLAWGFACCLRNQPRRSGMPTRLAASALLGAVAFCGLADKASAGFSVPGTGQQKTTAGGVTTDNNWKLVAMPTYCTSGNCATPPAFNPSVSSTAPVYIAPQVPAAWNNTGGNVNQVTVRGATYNWITYANYDATTGASIYGPSVTSPTGPNSTTSYFDSPLRSPSSPLSIATALTTPGGGAEFSGNYTYIMATEFTAQAGTYNLQFDASADNRFQLYLVPGALSGVQISRTGSYTDQQPGIAGNGADPAILLAENAADTPGQFGQNWNESNSSNVQSTVTFSSSGTYTLLYRITDNWSYSSDYSYGQTGAYAGATFFNDPSASVPGPLPLFGAATAFGASRRMRHRIKLSKNLPG